MGFAFLGCVLLVAHVLIKSQRAQRERRNPTSSLKQRFSSMRFSSTEPLRKGAETSDGENLAGHKGTGSADDPTASEAVVGPRGSRGSRGTRSVAFDSSAAPSETVARKKYRASVSSGAILSP